MIQDPIYSMSVSHTHTDTVAHTILTDIFQVNMG